METFEPNKTITELGIDTTRKFVVVQLGNRFQKGEILTLEEDDDTFCPDFKNKDGKIGNIRLETLAYYEEPKEEMREGDYVYVSNVSEEDAIESKVKRILLKKCKNGVVCIHINGEKEYQQGRAFATNVWKYAAPVPKTKTITLEVTDEEEREINLLLKK